MPQPKPKQLSYAEAVDILMDTNIRDDACDALTRLPQTMGLLVQRVGAVSKQMHTIDLQRMAAPMKPRWDGIWKEYSELIGQYQANAGYISGRLKLFWRSVLPVASRHEGKGRRSYEDSTVQVLQSFMTISAENAKLTRSLVERTMVLVREIVSFHTDLAQFVCQHVKSGQREVQDLSLKISELESQVRQVCSLNMEINTAGPTQSLSAIFRIIASFGKKPGRSRIPVLVYPQELSKVSHAFEALDTKRNEFAHAQYCAQVKSSPTEFLSRVQTTLSPLVADMLLCLESSLTFLLSMWARLRSDCYSILQCMRDPNAEAPVVTTYQQPGGKTIYNSLVQSLDTYISGLDLVNTAQVG